MTKTVMLIHGAWLTPLSWEFFKWRYEERGYTVVAPAWPHQDVPIEQLRRSPCPKLKTLTIGAIVDHYDGLVRALPESPIIIGHCFGGLVAQKLLDRGLGVAGVALAPAPIRGAFPRPRVLLSALPARLVPLGWNRILPMSFKHFARTFAQTLPEDAKRSAYERYWAPTPGRIHYQACAGVGTDILLDNLERPPLLMVAGEKDVITRPASVRAAFRRQRKSPSATEYKVFPGRSHFLFAEPGWQEVADFALHWASSHAHAPATVSATSGFSVPRERSPEPAWKLESSVLVPSAGPSSGSW